LSLGHIISQGADSSQRGAWLGSGFYAHTDGWASLRAGQGLLLSTTVRAGTYGSAQGGQLDVQEAVAQLKSAQQLGQALGEAAQGQGALALTSHDAKEQAAWQRLLQAIDITKDGKHPSELQGANREANEPVAQFAKPYIVFDTPSAAITVSPATIASYSGQDTTLVAQGDIHAAAAHTASLVSGETTSLYTHDGELQAIAANGKLSLRAHTDALELLADKDITVISVNDEITITAKERIEIVGGDSKVVLNGGDIEFATPGSFTVKAATHSWAGGGSGSATLTELPDRLLQPPKMPYSLRWQVVGAADGKPGVQTDVVAQPKNWVAKPLSLVTSSDGRTPRQKHETFPVDYVALIGSGDWVVEIDDGEAPVAMETSDWFDDEAVDENEGVE
jgi:type VI secretion system secreted protein VgrG